MTSLLTCVWINHCRDVSSTENLRCSGVPSDFVASVAVPTADK